MSYQRRIRLADQTETMPLLKAAMTRMEPGQVLVACLDKRRRLIELIPVLAPDNELPAMAETLALAPKKVRGIVIATFRPNMVPADTPEDEPRWESMQAALADSHVTLLDWFVVGERWAWSVAEHAATPAKW